MKQLQLLIIITLLFISTQLNAQVSIYSEDFEGVVSTTWVNNDLNTSIINGYSHPDSAWIVKQDGWYPYANAARFPAANLVATSCALYSPVGAADDWMMTPLINIPANCYLRWKVRGLKYSAVNLKPNGYKVKISTTGTNMNDYTTTLFTNPWTPYEWYYPYIDLSAYAGQTISIAFQNDTYNGYILQIDEIQIDQLLAYDMSGDKITTKIGVKQGVNNDITGRLRNFGNQTVTSMTMNYRINGGAVVSQPLTGLNITPMGYYYFTHPTPWVPASTGTAVIQAWASNINGNPDMILSNDTTSKTVEVYQDMTVKRPVYEQFSSADCGPCYSWNTWVHPTLINFNSDLANGDLSVIYNQMNWPGNPDPSYNPDGEARKTYYSIASIPGGGNVFEGSKTIGLDGYLFDKDWKIPTTYSDFSYAETPAFVEMDVVATKTGTQLDVDVTVNPLKDISSLSLRLHIAVVEMEYQYTGGQNGETEFYYVMRKMLPSASGTVVNPLTQYNSVLVSESYNFTYGNVAPGNYNLWNSLNNTAVVAFLQDNVTKEIYQSAVFNSWPVGINEYESLDYIMYPNPAQNQINIDFNTDLNEDTRITITAINGQVVHDKIYNNLNKAVVDISNLPNGMYIVNVGNNNFSRTEKVVKN